MNPYCIILGQCFDIVDPAYIDAALRPSDRIGSMAWRPSPRGAIESRTLELRMLSSQNALEHGRFYHVSERYPNVVPRMGDVLEKDMAYNA